MLRSRDRFVCIGDGQYLDQQQESVSPMAWTVRYVVDLDQLQAAVLSEADHDPLHGLELP